MSSLRCAATGRSSTGKTVLDCSLRAAPKATSRAAQGKCYCDDTSCLPIIQLPNGGIAPDYTGCVQRPAPPAPPLPTLAQVVATCTTASIQIQANAQKAPGATAASIIAAINQSRTYLSNCIQTTKHS